MTYIALHNHSEYSLSDSILRIPALVNFAREENMEAIALTDRNNLYAAVKFYKKARAAGIKPILGCDLSVRDDEGKVHQLLLLAQHREGFQRLCELVSFAYEYDQRPGEIAVDQARFTPEQCKGLIALSGGLAGDVGAAVLRGDLVQAKRQARHWQTVFGDRYYFQAARLGLAGEEDWLSASRELGNDLQIATVASNLACFPTAEDYDVHEARVCISHSELMEDNNRPRRFTEGNHLRGAEAMQGLFAEEAVLLENSATVARRCNVILDLGHNYLPDFPLPDGINIEQYLIQQSEKGLEERLLALFPDESLRAEKIPIYEKRLAVELDVINQMGFPGYFLIVADFIQWGKDHDVPVGPGRGSGAGSLVAYALKITDLDPLAYDLLFERFLNPERVSMPDFDVDFCMEKRDRVIRYVADKYGHEKVSQIATHGTMAAKAVVRDVGRVLGMPYPVVDRISKMVPNTLGVTLPDALGRTNKSQEKPEYFSPDLSEAYANNEDTRYLLDIALQLEGLARNVGKHAGGVVIAPTRLTDFSALYCEQAGSALVTQFDKDDIEAAGLVKFDFLGLRTLTVIDWALANVNRRRVQEGESPLAIESLPLDDEKTFALLKSTKTTAVFQLESSGMKNLIKKLQPDNFEDIVALVALFRPGPLQSGMVDDFINRKHGLAKVEYPHPALEPILNTTYGVMVYQEQVMQVAQVLANYSLGEADLLRRAMGKKKAEVMAEQKEIFVSRASADGVDQALATGIFDLMAKFAEYGFNKSHSAAYALLSYQTAWLKAHYPAEFMAAVLTSDMDKTDKIVHLIDECQDMGLTVRPPSVNQSAYAFTVDEDGAIVFGLGAVKGVGQGAIELLAAERARGGEFTSLLNLCERMDLKTLKRKTLETLIYAGAFDDIEPNRGGLFAALEQAIKLAEQHHHNQSVQQSDMFGLFAGDDQASEILPVLAENAWEKREALEYEKQTLGLFLSDHPVNAVRKPLRAMCGTTLAEVAAAIGGWEIPRRRGEFRMMKIGGLVVDIRQMITKKGQAMAFVTLDDRSGRREVTLFGETWEKMREQLAVDQVVIMEVKADYAFYQQEWRFTVETLWPFEQAQFTLARAMVIEAESDHFHQEVVADLGRCRVEEQEAGVRITLNLHSSNAQAAGRLHLQGRYRYDAGSAAMLARHFSENQIRLIY